MKRVFFLFLIICHPFFAEEAQEQPSVTFQSPKNFKLLLDARLSPKAASSSMLSLHSGLESFADRFYKLDSSSINHTLLRFVEMFFGWMPLNRMTMVTQHEIFGHGYRLREFGSSVGKVKKYVINPPLPYGLGGGATAFSPTDKLGPMHKAIISIAGMEGTSLLAHELKTAWFEQGHIDPRKAYMYVTAHHDPTMYALLMQSSLPLASKGHDMESYLYILRRMYPGSKLTVNQLKLLSMINFIDPMTYSCINSMWNYVITGKASRLDTTHLWNMRLGLAPYGPESYIEHHRFIGNKPIYTYVKSGQFAKNHYFGCGFEHRHLWAHGSHKAGVRADLWYHPKLNFKTNGYTLENLYQADDYGLQSLGNQLGCAVTCAYSIQSGGPFGAELQFGAKTSGYLPGASLSAAPILRGSFHLKY